MFNPPLSKCWACNKAAHWKTQTQGFKTSWAPSNNRLSSKCAARSVPELSPPHTFSQSAIASQNIFPPHWWWEHSSTVMVIHTMFMCINTHTHTEAGCSAQHREAFNKWQPSANLIRLMCMLQWATYLLFDLHSAAAGGRMERKANIKWK